MSQPAASPSEAVPTSPRTLTIYKVIADGFPTYRADVAVLFGKYLPVLGIRTHLVAQLAPGIEADKAPGWPGGTLELLPRYESRMRSHLAAFVGTTRSLLRLPKGRFDAIQIRDQVFVAIPGLFVARRLGVPFFYWMSFPLSEAAQRTAADLGLKVGLIRFLVLWTRGRLGAWLLYHVILPRSDFIFVQSDRMREDVARMGIDPAKMMPVPMGIDPERFARAATVPVDRSRLAGRRVIAYLGTCDRMRRIDFLFEVLARVRARVPDAMLLIVGDAPEDEDKRWLRQRAVDIGVADDVLITGWVAPEEGQAWMANAEVAVSIFAPDPLLDSCSPTKLVEYLAMGKAVVANDQPDQSVVVNESQAGLCVPFEVEPFASAVERLLADPREASRMAARGPDYVRRQRSYPILAEQVAAAYRRWIGS